MNNFSDMRWRTTLSLTRVIIQHCNLVPRYEKFSRYLFITSRTCLAVYGAFLDQLNYCVQAT